MINRHGILGIYETHLPVKDLSRSISFYQDKLGLELAATFPERDIAFFWVGGKDQGMLGLWGCGSAPLSMTLHFAFRADKATLLSSCQTLQSAEITPLGFNGEPASEPVVIGWMPALSIYFKDPDGHSIEMLHMLDQPADPSFGVKSYSEWTKRHRA